MTRLKTVLTATVLLIVPMTGSAAANDKPTVQKFYDFLSNPTSTQHADALRTVVAVDWKSIGDYSGKTKSRDAFIGQVGGFGKLIPDLNWAVEDMVQAGDRVVVRGRATGTPAGPMFGVDGKGKSFDIMSIDIHTIEGGRIVRTYHVEDWAGALRQLKSQ